MEIVRHFILNTNLLLLLRSPIQDFLALSFHGLCEEIPTWYSFFGPFTHEISEGQVLSLGKWDVCSDKHIWQTDCKLWILWALEVEGSLLWNAGSRLHNRLHDLNFGWMFLGFDMLFNVIPLMSREKSQAQPTKQKFWFSLVLPYFFATEGLDEDVW